MSAPHSTMCWSTRVPSLETSHLRVSQMRWIASATSAPFSRSVRVTPSRWSPSRRGRRSTDPYRRSSPRTPGPGLRREDEVRPGDPRRCPGDGRCLLAGPPRGAAEPSPGPRDSPAGTDQRPDPDARALFAVEGLDGAVPGGHRLGPGLHHARIGIRGTGGQRGLDGRGRDVVHLHREYGQGILAGVGTPTAGDDREHRLAREHAGAAGARASGSAATTTRFVGKGIGVRFTAVASAGDDAGSRRLASAAPCAEARAVPYPVGIDAIYVSLFALDLAGNVFDWYDRYKHFDLIPHAHGGGAIAVLFAWLLPMPVRGRGPLVDRGARPPRGPGDRERQGLRVAERPRLVGRGRGPRRRELSGRSPTGRRTSGWSATRAGSPQRRSKPDDRSADGTHGRALRGPCRSAVRDGLPDHGDRTSVVQAAAARGGHRDAGRSSRCAYSWPSGSSRGRISAPSAADEWPASSSSGYSAGSSSRRR